MKKYNRDKRAKYNACINKNKYTYDTCNGHDTHKSMNIKIHVRYDGHAQTIYIPIIYGKTRNNKARTYVGMHNIIRDIFPSIDKPHTQHIYRATAPYHTFIPQETDYTRPIDTDDHTYKDMKRVKCIIYNRQDEIIHYGIFTRLITLNYITHETHITLHRADRQIEVHEYIPRTDTIHGITIKEIRAHDVEIYHI